MSLTIQEIWERYSEVEPVRIIEVKRVDVSGVYESSWVDVEDLVDIQIKPKDVCDNIEFKLPNDTYSFGAVTVNNAKLTFENIYGEFSDETNSRSIFNGFIRHKSLIRIRDGFIDKYTDPNNPQEIITTTFEGFIDDRLCETSFNNQETVIATEILSTLLKEITLKEITPLSSITINNLVYEIMNRAYFTDFFTVAAGNISAGYNATSFDITKYDDTITLFDLFQNFSMGHSIFYVRSGVLYYKGLTPPAGVVIDFGVAPERKIKLDNYSTGADAVKDKLYWKDSNAEFVAANRIYNETYTFEIDGFTSLADQQGMLTAVGPIISARKKTFQLTIPFLPILEILNRVTITRTGYVLPGSFILDISHLDEATLLDAIGAIIISSGTEWAIKGIKHTKKYETVLNLEQIPV